MPAHKTRTAPHLCELDTLFAIGSLNDRVLVIPIRIALDSDRAVVLDAGDQFVKALSFSGPLL
jgi:hypothetical protein